MLQKPSANSMAGFVVSNNFFFFRKNDLISLSPIRQLHGQSHPGNHSYQPLLFLYVQQLMQPRYKHWQYQHLQNLVFVQPVYVCLSVSEILIGFKMHFKNCFTAFYIRTINRYLPVETTRT